MKHPRPARHVLAAALAAALAAGLTACGSDSDNGGDSTATPRATTTAPASPTTGSPTPRTQQDFEESVSAESERVRASASAQLNEATGRGNATADVSQQGVATARSDGSRAALIRVTNSTDKTAFYAVQVDFVNASGDVVDSRVVGFENVAPGQRVERYVVSKKAGEENTTPRIAKAQRS